VALARALARNPRVLLLDEPFGALDAITRRQVRDELGLLLAELKLPSLLVTHSFDDAAALAHRIGVIDHGRLVQLTTASELLRSPANALVAGLTGANVLRGTAVPTAAGSTVRLAGGGELTSAARAEGPVQVAVYPWELEFEDPRFSPVTDVVRSVGHEHGHLVIHLSRFLVQADRSGPGTSLVAGQVAGLRAAPDDVRILSDAG
jgi:ABC-type sulfate/molybdate transport systems ATPase subunit